MNARSPSSVDQFVGKKIRHVRKTAGLSMVELAEKLGISYQQVQKYEIGANRVSAGILYEIACLFVLDIRDFFPPIPADEHQHPSRDDLVKELVEQLNQAGILEAVKSSLDQAYSILETETSFPSTAA